MNLVLAGFTSELIKHANNITTLHMTGVRLPPSQPGSEGRPIVDGKPIQGPDFSKDSFDPPYSQEGNPRPAQHELAGAIGSHALQQLAQHKKAIGTGIAAWMALRHMGKPHRRW